jgi:5,10-methylenetetrahydromethanopterin reductase
VNLTEVALDSPPEPPPPILIGSTGPRGLALAGAHADGFLLPEGCGPTFVARAVRQSSAAASSGRRPLAVVYTWMRVEDDDDRARSALRPVVDGWIERGLYPEPAAAAGIDSPLTPGPVAATLAADLAIAGDPPACAAAARRFIDAATDRLIVTAVGPDHVRQYERFAHEVLPRI